MAEAHQLHTSTPAEPDTTYEARPALRYAAAVGLQGAGIGAVVSAVQNALGSHSKGAAGFFTRTGGTIGIFAAMGATYALTEAAVANQRQKEDTLNSVAGGCAAGFLAGIRAHSIPAAVASCAVLGAIVGSAEYGGRKIAGSTEDNKEERRKRFFKQPKPSPEAQTAE